MFEQLKRMATLVTVVEQGSFGAAARALGTTTSAVSQQVRALEQSLGLPLLARTTRQLRLTTAGASFHRECVAMVEAARRAEFGFDDFGDVLFDGLELIDGVHEVTGENDGTHAGPAVKLPAASERRTQTVAT